MKKVIVLLLVVLSLGGYAIYYLSGENEIDKTQFLRIHVRANSNSNEDQKVKYMVKDAVVSELYSIVANCETKAQLIDGLNENKPHLENVANQVLKENNFTYKAKISVNDEYFPTRHYNNELTLESGVYDAIIVGLGSACGDNWWCIAYPPLCFTDVKYNGSCKIYYKSKIAEIIKRFFN